MLAILRLTYPCSITTLSVICQLCCLQISLRYSVYGTIYLPNLDDTNKMPMLMASVIRSSKVCLHWKFVDVFVVTQCNTCSAGIESGVEHKNL